MAVDHSSTHRPPESTDTTMFIIRLEWLKSKWTRVTSSPQIKHQHRDTHPVQLKNQKNLKKWRTEEQICHWVITISWTKPKDLLRANKTIFPVISVLTSPPRPPGKPYLRGKVKKNNPPLATDPLTQRIAGQTRRNWWEFAAEAPLLMTTMRTPPLASLMQCDQTGPAEPTRLNWRQPANHCKTPVNGLFWMNPHPILSRTSGKLGLVRVTSQCQQLTSEELNFRYVYSPPMSQLYGSTVVKHFFFNTNRDFILFIFFPAWLCDLKMGNCMVLALFSGSWPI